MSWLGLGGKDKRRETDIENVTQHKNERDFDDDDFVIFRDHAIKKAKDAINKWLKGSNYKLDTLMKRSLFVEVDFDNEYKSRKTRPRNPSVIVAEQIAEAVKAALVDTYSSKSATNNIHDDIVVYVRGDDTGTVMMRGKNAES